MSSDDPSTEDLAGARQAVDDAAEALVVASKKRVPSPELAAARSKLKDAEARLEQLRRTLTREAASVSLKPKGPDEAPRRRTRP